MEVHIISERQFLASMFSLSHSLSFLTRTGGTRYVITKVFNPTVSYSAQHNASQSATPCDDDDDDCADDCGDDGKV